MLSFNQVNKKIKLYFKKILKKILLSNIFHVIFKIIAVLFGVVVVLYVGYVFLSKNLEGNVIISESEIINRVSKHISLPDNGLISVTRVDNAESLRKQNDFYRDVKDGEYVLAYETALIIYDLRNDVIIAKK